MRATMCKRWTQEVLHNASLLDWLHKITAECASTQCRVDHINEAYAREMVAPLGKKGGAHRVILYPQAFFLSSPGTRIICYSKGNFSETWGQFFEDEGLCEEAWRKAGMNLALTNKSPPLAAGAEDLSLSRDELEARVTSLYPEDMRIYERHCGGGRNIHNRDTGGDGS